MVIFSSMISYLVPTSAAIIISALFLLYRTTASKPTKHTKMSLSNGPPTHDIVILGAGFGGVSVAHTLLKTTIPSLPNPKSFKVTMIAPNTQFYWNVAAPRYIANPEMLPEAKFFLDIAPGLSKYGSQFRQQQAYVISIESSTQLISYGPSMDGPASGTLHYDTLVVATGSTYMEAMWSSSVHEQATKKALAEIHAKLAGAKSILVAGGGITGVETSGELGFRYSGTKDVALLSGSSRLLSKLKDPRMGADAQRRLEKLGVNVVHKTRIMKAEKKSFNAGHQRVIYGRAIILPLSSIIDQIPFILKMRL